MARDGLRKELPNAFQRALREPIELRNIKIRNNNGDFNYATITIKQIESPDQLKGMVLIVLRRREEQYNHIYRNRKSKLPLSGRQKELESELQQSKEDLLNSREQMQASQEELKVNQ
jgi:two-component system CheB/CheR fusion protein